MKTSLLKVHPCLRVLMMCIILHGEAKISVAGSNSCDITRSTVHIVDGCPLSKEKWVEAAAMKNCEQYASQCSEPERLVYHCVINPYVNQTLEVCAYAQNIVLGQCPSYFHSGNLIQGNSRADCSKFKVNACPRFYRSDDAYKYPRCYHLTKKLTTIKSTGNPDKTLPFTTPSSNITLMLSGMTGKGKEMGNSIEIIVIIVIVISVVIIVLVVFVVRRVIGEKNKRRQSLGESPKEGEGDLLKT